MGGKIVPARARSGAEIDLIAFKIIKITQPEVLQEPQPFRVEEFFEFDMEDMTGIRTNYDHLPPGIHGVTDSERMTSSVEIGLLSDSNQLEFARSTIAHECGHGVIHVPEFRSMKQVLRSIQDTDDVQLKMYRKEQVPVYRNPEWQAHRFAGALLVPETTLRTAWVKCQDVNRLAQIYQVYPAFMRSRLRALKLVD
jgi:hypothetical protein